MSMNTFSFLVFMMGVGATMAVLQLLRKSFVRSDKAQITLLLVASYLFILKSDWRFCVCVALVTAVTYAAGRWIEENCSPWRLGVGCAVLILFLGYFKYAGFFINSFRRLFGLDTVILKIILPLGISFYVFSAVSYLIDVYRGDYPAERNLLYVALYIAFFPKLTAGPIVRGKDFFPQVKDYRGCEWKAAITGIQIFVFGLFKKIVLADRLGVFVDDVFRVPMAFNTGTVILAVVSYSLQIYFDFSGYSDMAIGISKILGFDFEPNFNLPYISRNVSEFWNRWHISLSTWFRDYLYIPLGGSRKGAVRTCVNLIIVMLVSGLWHGAGWTFVAWGALHGMANCVNRALDDRMKALGTVINVAITFITTTMLWVVFRADSLLTAISVYKGMLTVHGGINQPYTWFFFAALCLFVGTAVAIWRSRANHCVDKHGSLKVNGFYPTLGLTKLWELVVFFSFCGITILLGYFGNTAFIYGAF